MKPHIWFYKGQWGVSRWNGDLYRWVGDTITEAWECYQTLHVAKQEKPR